MTAALGFEAAYAPMFAALNNDPGAAGAMTPEMLAKNVSDAIGQIVGQAIADAITHALAGYQRANGLAPEPAIKANIENVAINAANDFRARSTESPVVVHGDMSVLKQLRRDMGIDDFVFDDTLFGAARPGIPSYSPVDAVAFTQEAAFSPSTPSLDAIRSAAVSDRQPAEVLGSWAEELKWLAAEIGHVRDPETVAPEWARDLGMSVGNLPPRALPARLGAWLAACDIRPTLANLAADTTAWLRSGTSYLFDPFRGGQVRVRTWVVSLAGGLRLL